MGVFACGWRGLVFAISGCVRVGVCVLACVRSLGGGGAWFAPPPLHAHCPLAAWAFGAHALVWALLACAMLPWVRGSGNGAGQRCPAPCSVALGCLWSPRGAERERERGVACGVLSWCANTRAHAQRDGRGGGATWGGPWWPGRGLWVVARWVVTRVGGDKCPKTGESKIGTTGAGAGCAPGRGGSFGSGCAWWLGSWWGRVRGGCGFWWWRSFLWVRG